MKHLEAGLVVGGICLAVLLVIAVVWSFLNALLGSLAATASLFLVASIVTVVVIVDWKTEKR